MEVQEVGVVMEQEGASLTRMVRVILKSGSLMIIFIGSC